MNNGNWRNGTMTTRGYNIIRRKYEKLTNLKHDTKQLKNRINNLKPVRQFGARLIKNTGLGLKADGTIDATPEWWKENTKVLSVFVSFSQTLGYTGFLISLFLELCNFRGNLQSVRSFSGAGLRISPCWNRCSEG
jgi:hypothetical protein